jgi:hypothetical protein
METGQQVFDAVMEYFRSGFYSVNGLKGLLIAILAAYYLIEWRRIFIVALGAVAAHVVLDVLIPVIVWSGPFALPPIVEPSYWQMLLKLYAGYLIVISVFFLVKRLMQGGGR